MTQCGSLSSYILSSKVCVPNIQTATIALNFFLTDTIDDAIVMCQTCRHGGHAAHILDWFYGEDGVRSHGVCAVADCDCQCAEEM
jgi:hypothetical protein